MIDYATLRLIWWVLLGVLFIGFAIMDGIDLGAMALLPFLSQTDMEKRIVINTVAPVWEGNQVWIILSAGALFAAWPSVYATAFSSMYMAALLLLMTLGIIRPVGFKYRSKSPSSTWRYTWDTLLFLSGILTPVLIGVAVGNVILGIPFQFDNTLRLTDTASFWVLINPFALYCGVATMIMMMMQGSLYVASKTLDDISVRARLISIITGSLLLLLFIGGGFWAHALTGYHVMGKINTEALSNPLHKHVITQVGAWTTNYTLYPWMQTAPILGCAGIVLTLLLTLTRFFKCAMITSSVAIFGIISSVGCSIFPFLLPSSTHPDQSLLVWDASSSPLTLQIMLICSIIFIPIILAYTAWVYRVMRGPVTADHIQQDTVSYY